MRSENEDKTKGRAVLLGIAFAVWLVFAFVRAVKAETSFSADFRTLKTRGETFRVDWATGIIRELQQATEKYRPVAQDLSPALGGPEPYSRVNRTEPLDRGVRYHNVSETFVLEYPGGRLPFTLKEAQGAVDHHYFYEAEGKRLSAIWITGRKDKTGKLLLLSIELRGKKYDAPVAHPELAKTRAQIGGGSPIGFIPAFGLGWVVGSQLLGSGFLTGVIGATILGIAYFIVFSVIERRHNDRVDSQLSALREFVGQEPTPPLDPSTAPA